MKVRTTFYSGKQIVLFVGSCAILSQHLAALCHGYGLSFESFSSFSELAAESLPPAPSLLIVDRGTTGASGDTIHWWSEKLGKRSAIILFGTPEFVEDLGAELFSPHLNQLLMVSGSIESLERAIVGVVRVFRESFGTAIG
ncbi:MAG: hypothetical protein EOP04_01095 [Proteobacteria bacterium]|nr:MAG: hypothetical protein EOP04_01095 [Pseudomonadota bacterium]